MGSKNPWDTIFGVVLVILICGSRTINCCSGGGGGDGPGGELPPAVIPDGGGGGSYSICTFLTF